MWQISSPFCAEPEELRLLKERLARVNCKCSLCHNCEPSLRQLYDPSFESITYTKEIETQCEPIQNVQAEDVSKYSHCPSCCVTMNLLRSQGVAVKVLKDEESETLASMFSSDKATYKGHASQMSVTVLKRANIPLSENSSVTCAPTTTSSETTIRNTKNNSLRKRCLDKVTFSVPYEYPAKPHDAQNCVCLEDFIATIRPPMD
ncbi:hypothetical protein PYW07_003283 [Mythimna separata]|uniref:Uncharacterized protein n=1 Tax=Mythimna separata TaxID=271217 RepID=A0AAD7YID9_MYTSE|nr:hypothetical protein PYW07_003283 [Mythimna separata]